MASSDVPPSGDREVMSSLPNARPQRRTAKRDRARPKAAGAAEPAANGAKASAAKTAPRTPKKAPRAPREAPVPPAGYATPRDDAEGPRGADLLTTAVQAVGELAQIGIAAGGRALKSALQRLPRP